MPHTPDSISDEYFVEASLVAPETFGVLIERYEEKLRRYIQRLGIHVFEDQQDVLQEIFIKAYRNLNSFDTSLSFSSWIYRIAHNEAISWYRKHSVRPEGHLIAESDELLGLLATKEHSSEVQFDQALNATEIARALVHIDQKYREVMILRYFEHKEYEEISDILKIPIGSVGTLIHRGKKQLADELNRDALRI